MQKYKKTKRQKDKNTHLKNQLLGMVDSVGSGTENDLFNEVLCQFILLAFVLNAFWMEPHKVKIVLRQVHEHVASLAVERIPPQVVDTPPVISVFLTS